MIIIIKVDCNEGEENITINQISPEELAYIEPLLFAIQNNFGYWTNGNQWKYPDPKPEMCYKLYNGIDILKSYLPNPINGIKRIDEIHIFQETPSSLYM